MPDISSNTFRYEYQMIPHIENGLVSTLPYLQSSKHVLKAHEISLGWGVADLVMCPSEEPSALKPVTSLLAIQVLYGMKCEEVLSLKQIYKRTLIKKEILSRKVINPLLNSGYLEEMDNKYRKVIDINTKAKNLIAVEAKLRDWRRAFKQALRYKLFADRVFVVLADSCINPLIRGNGLGMYKEAGIGLATINTRGYTKILLQAKKNEPYSKPLSLLAHQILEKYAFNKTASPNNPAKA